MHFALSINFALYKYFPDFEVVDFRRCCAYLAEVPLIVKSISVSCDPKAEVTTAIERFSGGEYGPMCVMVPSLCGKDYYAAY